jgi:hypothetical protein
MDRGGWRSRAWVVIAVTAVIFGCRAPRDPARPRLEEVRSRSVQGDPAVTGAGTMPALTREPELSADDGFEGSRTATWLSSRITVAGTATMRLPVATPGLVMIRAVFDGPATIELIVTQDGQELARGVAEPAGLVRRSTFVRADVARAGDVVVSLSGPAGVSVVADVVSAVVTRPDPRR